MIENEIIAIIDTETVNAQASFGFNINGNMFFDMGFVLWDSSKNEIIKEYNSIVKEVWEDASLMKGYFFGDEKKQWYIDEIAAGRLDVKPIKTIAQEIRGIIEEYDVYILAAYNAGFDVKSIKDTSLKYGAGLIFDFDDSEVWDIYHIACQALQGNENFIVSCVENGFVTDKGNVKATAESVFSFIHNDYSFVEDHTALSDAIIETDILHWSLNQEQEMSTVFARGINPAAWRLVQRKKKK